jgi:hypothetical protein
MESMALSKDKFSRRSMVKDEKAEVRIAKVDADDGWDVNAYKMTKNKDGSCVPKALPPPLFYEAYGQTAPEEAEYEAHVEEHVDKKYEDGDIIYVDRSFVSRMTKITFDLVIEYMEENHFSGWIDRARIAKYLEETGKISNQIANSRLEKVIQKGTTDKTDDGIMFKKNGTTWKVKKI